jgi:uridine kinase
MPPGGSAGRVIGAVTGWRAGRPGLLVVAIDGHGAAGKSTIAAAVAAATGAALVHTDDFFLAPPEPSLGPRSLAGYYDWRRLRTEALVPLRARRAARFRRFDWERGSGLAGMVVVEPRDLIVVEGVFSAAPELSDLVDRSVFIDTPEPERLRRLRGRVAPEEWDDEWLAAERAYFELTRAPSSFDLVVPGTRRARQVSAR